MSENAPDSPGSSDSPSSVHSPPTPLPHTPLFSPQHPSLPSTNQQGDELTPQLLQLGWRKCHSQRENKYYFFNKLTQQSQWELPELGARKRSRTISSEEPPPPVKRFVPSDDWDLTISSNAKMNERVPFAIYPPHPDTEAKRLEAVIKLRTVYNELCHSKAGIDPPPDSLNRWIVERTLENVGKDPIFALEYSSEGGRGMLRDLLSSVPIRMQKLSGVSDARRQLSRYAEAARHLADSCRHVSADQRKMIKWQCQAMFDWLRQPDQSAVFDEFVNRLKFLRGQCQSILEQAQRPEMESICIKMGQSAREMAIKLQEQHRQMLNNCGIDTQEYPLPPPRADKIVPCYSAQLRFPSPRLPTVTMEQSTDDKWVRLKFREEHTKLNATHFFKLEQLYKYNCFDDRRYDLFLARVWTLLKRYQCLYGPSANEGSAIHQSLPVSVFYFLHHNFGVTFECFASPFNCYFRQFCSIFADTDGYFGSRGIFEHFEPVEGSFVLKPIPFCMQLSMAYIRHCLTLLSSNQSRCLSFIVLVLDWRPPNQRQGQEAVDWSENDEQIEMVNLMRDSGFNRYKELLLPAFGHWYRNGAQQWLQKDDLYQRSSFGTQIFWLQTDSAAQKWPVTDEKVAKLAEAFKFPNSTGC